MMDDVRSYWNRFNKYTSQTPFASYRNGYLYIHNDKNARRVNIRGMFEDPEQVHKFTRENGMDLYDEDSPFPISTDMIEGITKGLLSGELTMMLETPTDTTTDKLQSQ
jgi:type I site-specific restriction endonuclease